MVVRMDYNAVRKRKRFSKIVHKKNEEIKMLQERVDDEKKEACVIQYQHL